MLSQTGSGSSKGKHVSPPNMKKKKLDKKNCTMSTKTAVYQRWKEHPLMHTAPFWASTATLGSGAVHIQAAAAAADTPAAVD
jgi:hypothetical protein